LEFEVPLDRPIEKGALRAEYFRPDSPRQVMAMSYLDHPVLGQSGKVRFQLPPLISENNPDQLSGSLVLFLQLFRAEDWATQTGCQKISNVAACVVSLQ
jgi:hypothetical protein